MDRRMQKGHVLTFRCEDCDQPVTFSVVDLDKHHSNIVCEHCSKEYALSDPTLKRQLTKFEALCRQIAESEEILGNAAIGIDVGPHHIKVPYKILLSRLNSSLELTLGSRPLTIEFRMEPVQDLKEYVK